MRTSKNVIPGFTLVELLIVIALCAALFYYLFPVFAGAASESRQRPPQSLKAPKQLHQQNQAEQQETFSLDTVVIPLAWMAGGYLLMFGFSCVKTWAEYHQIKSAFHRTA